MINAFRGKEKDIFAQEDKLIIKVNAPHNNRKNQKIKRLIICKKENKLSGIILRKLTARNIEDFDNYKA